MEAVAEAVVVGLVSDRETLACTKLAKALSRMVLLRRIVAETAVGRKILGLDVASNRNSLLSVQQVEVHCNHRNSLGAVVVDNNDDWVGDECRVKLKYCPVSERL